MEVTSIRDRFIDQITTLEELQDDMFTSLSELASPAYYNSNLPSFTKRNTTDSKSLSSISVTLGNSTSNYRSNQLKIIVEKWNAVLHQGEEAQGLQSGRRSHAHSEMPSLRQGCERLWRAPQISEFQGHQP